MRKPNNKTVLAAAAAAVVVGVAAGGTVYAVNNDSDADSVVSEAPTGNPAVPVDDSEEVPSPPKPSETILGPTKTEDEPAEDTHEPAEDPEPRSSTSTNPTTSAVPTTTSSSDSANYKAPLESEPEPYERPAAVTETMAVPLPDDVQDTLDSNPELGEAGAIPGRHVSTRDDDEDSVDDTGPADGQAGGTHDGEESQSPAAGAIEGNGPVEDKQADASQSDPADAKPATEDTQPVLDVAAPEETNEPGAPAPAPAVPAEPVAPAPEPAIPAAPEPVEPAVPTADELDASLRSALAPGAPDPQIASAFEAGPSMILLGRALADGTAAFGGAVTWSIVGPVVPSAGGVDAALSVSSPFGVAQVPVTLVNIDGSWKISASSTPSVPGLPL